jgi:hypothetical protein
VAFASRVNLGFGPSGTHDHIFNGNKYTRNNRRTVGRAVFYAIRVVSKEEGDYFFLELLVKYYLNDPQTPKG